MVMRIELDKRWWIERLAVCLLSAVVGDLKYHCGSNSHVPFSFPVDTLPDLGLWYMDNLQAELVEHCLRCGSANTCQKLRRKVNLHQILLVFGYRRVADGL